MSGQISTVVITKNERLKELITLYMKEYESFQIIEFDEDYSNLSELSELVAIIDMDSDNSEILTKLSLSCPNCKIVVIKENPDVNFIVSVIRQGAKEILAYPVIKSEFKNSMDKIKFQYSADYTKQERCKMITVFSNKGGIGKTSIAANLALELAKVTKENVALIDLNFQFGDITTFMDLQPSFDISYMFDNLNSLNREFLYSTMEQYKNTSLYVLADSPYFRPSKQITSKQVAKFFEILKENFAYVIVDTDSAFDAKTITTLDQSDIIFLVTIVNLPALRNCQRCLNLFEKMGYDDNKVQIIINRYMENDEISLEDVEKLLNKSVYFKIPNNYFALMASINKGVLLSELNSSSNVAQSYKELSFNVADTVFRNEMVKKFNYKENRRLENILEM